MAQIRELSDCLLYFIATLSEKHAFTAHAKRSYPAMSFWEEPFYNTQTLGCILHNFSPVSPLPIQDNFHLFFSIIFPIDMYVLLLCGPFKTCVSFCLALFAPWARKSMSPSPGSYPTSSQSPSKTLNFNFISYYLKFLSTNPTIFSSSSHTNSFAICFSAIQLQ